MNNLWSATVAQGCILPRELRTIKKEGYWPNDQGTSVKHIGYQPNDQGTSVKHIGYCIMYDALCIRPIELKFSQVCYFVHRLSYTK